MGRYHTLPLRQFPTAIPTCEMRWTFLPGRMKKPIQTKRPPRAKEFSYWASRGVALRGTRQHHQRCICMPRALGYDALVLRWGPSKVSKVGTVTAGHGTLSSGYTDTDALSRFESVHFPTSQLRSTGFGILSTTKAEPWMMTYLSGIVHIRAEARGACYGLLD